MLTSEQIGGLAVMATVLAVTGFVAVPEQASPLITAALVWLVAFGAGTIGVFALT